MDGTPNGWPAITRGNGPHAGRPIIHAGAGLGEATTVLIALHGRGGAPDDMIALSVHLGIPDSAVVLALGAAARSWWPDSFLAPLAANEPDLSSALSVVSDLVDDLTSLGVEPQRIALMGFSQGACLALEAAARMAKPLRAVAAFSGGLVGTADAGGVARDDLYGRPSKAFGYSGRLDGVPILIGCHERDPHIPLARVRESEDVLSGMGADVDVITIPGTGHGIVEAEVAWLRERLG